MFQHPNPYECLQPGRIWNSDQYRFGFNGKENDNEVKGIGNSVDFGARIYDSRLGRWMACDPKGAKYPGISPYVFVANSPIIAIDPNGEEIVVTSETNEETGKTTITITLTGVVSFDHLSTYVSEKQKEAYVNNLNEKMQEVYSKSMSSENVEVVFVSNLRLGTDEDVTPSDHAVYVTNLQTGPNKVGNSRIAGFVNAIGGRKAYFPKALDFHNAAHELGHWLGLAHPKDIAAYVENFALTYDITKKEEYAQYAGWTWDKAYYSFSWDNIMHHPGDPGASEYGGEGFDYIQVLMIMDASLNQGGNGWDFENDNPTNSTRGGTEDATITLKNVLKNAATLTTKSSGG